MQTLTLKQKLMLGFAAAHLVLVVCGAASVAPVPRGNPAGETLACYAAASGADNGYGFFAPGVGPQFRTRFILSDGEGRTWSEDLQIGNSQEANLRFTGISSLLVTMEPPLQHRILQSFAATMFGRHADAQSVTVRVEMLGFDRSPNESDFPTMAEYRSGVRPKWLPLMEATFQRSS